MDSLYKNYTDPSKDIYLKLDDQTNAFWEWSKNQKQILEWETDYNDWNLIYALTQEIFDTTRYDDWEVRTINNLLYIIARDNECETIIEQLIGQPQSFISLSIEALRYPDSEARCQFAHYLSKIANQYIEGIQGFNVPNVIRLCNLDSNELFRYLK
ncbi:hypothetical protein NYE48_05115 [Paenibacillus sp. FSL M7-1455]|jgi:hypothetical protein|uniref:hypothetical protein n=1 Tax=Paenibacillus sp. FSL M7-1455 TaxID=2975316 RepID=UPI0030FB654F